MQILLYSQMTAMLDILELYCEMRDHSFVRFDGSTPCDERFADVSVLLKSEPTLYKQKGIGGAGGSR